MKLYLPKQLKDFILYYDQHLLLLKMPTHLFTKKLLKAISIIVIFEVKHLLISFQLFNLRQYDFLVNFHAI